MSKCVKGKNDLKTWCKQNDRQDLIDQYSDKNEILIDQISFGSRKKVIWKLHYDDPITGKLFDFEWEATCHSRTSRDQGCPYLSNQKVWPGFNDFKTWCELNGRQDLIDQYSDDNQLSINQIYYGSDRCVVWELPYDDFKTGKHFDFKWETNLRDRVRRQSDCPYLLNKKVWPGFNDLKTWCELNGRQDLIDQYSDKNEIAIDQIAPHSDQNVIWQMPYDDPKTGKHFDFEWEAMCGDRTRLDKPSGCPYLSISSVRVWPGFNDLQTVNPGIAKEWDYEKNEDLKPTDVTCGSSKKVWWKCSKGHEWEATIGSRSAGNDCPYCKHIGTSKPEQIICYYISQICETKSREKVNGYEVDVVLPEYNIGVEYDGKYYHKNSQDKEYKKNCGVSDFGMSLIRIKESDHNEISGNIIYYKWDGLRDNYVWALSILFEWLSILTGIESFRNIDIDLKCDDIIIREQYALSTLENSIAIVLPTLSKEWDYEKNGLLSPEMFSVKSAQKVWWRCSKGHEWQMTISNRSNGHGCPYCAGKKAISGINDLETWCKHNNCEDLLKEWDYEKNGGLTPINVMFGSGRKVWWKCSKGHEWQTQVRYRSSGHGCPYCNTRSKKVLCIETNQIYSSLVKAADDMNVYRTNISNCCKNRLKTAGGYHWKYIDD